MSNDLPEIFKIDCASEDSDIDLSRVVTEHRGIVKSLIDNYNPNKKRESEVKMAIMLRDNEPVYQRPRCLSPTEKEKVNAHV